MQDDRAEALQAVLAERAVQDLYSAARIRPGDAPGALALAEAVFGDDCIQVVPRRSIPRNAALTWNGHRPVIHLRDGLSRRQMNHCAAHELGEWHLKMHGYTGPESEELAGRIAAGICVPHRAFFAARQVLGENLAALSRAFAVSESLMALRVAECLGPATALITPRKIRIRGAAWPWPAVSRRDDWRELVTCGTARGLVVQRLRDSRGRVVLRVP